MHPVWDVPQITNIEQTMVRWSVVAAQSRAIHAKCDIQFLNAHVVNGHVVSALEKCRVNREKRLQSLRRQTTGEERGVFFRNANVEVAVGMRRLKKSETGATRHGRGDGHDIFIGIGELCQRFADGFRVSRRRRRRRLACPSLYLPNPWNLSGLAMAGSY